MTDTPDLRDQIALVGVIQHELELARAGEGYEEPAVAEEIVAKCVAPLLAADRADLRIRRNALADVLGVPASDDERGADFHALVQRVADLLAAKDTEIAALVRDLRDARAALAELQEAAHTLRSERDHARAARVEDGRMHAHHQDQLRAAFDELAQHERTNRHLLDSTGDRLCDLLTQHGAQVPDPLDGGGIPAVLDAVETVFRELRAEAAGLAAREATPTDALFRHTLDLGGPQ